MPLWAQVLADLRRRIATGEFGDRFPGDVELVAQYNVSRHTIREAVRHLQNEGVLERRRGHGSHLVSLPIEQPVGTLYSLFRSIEGNGITQESIVLSLEERQDERAASVLGCKGKPLLFLERVRLADGEPIAVDWAWLPLEITRPLLDVDFHHTALYEQLRSQCGIRLSGGWERVRPILPARQQRELLHIGPRQPAFAIERVGYVGEDPVEWRHTVVRGDRFAFVARWTDERLATTLEPSEPSLEVG